MRTVTRFKKALIRRLPVLKHVQTAFYHLKPYQWKYRAYYLDHGLSNNPETASGPGSTLAATKAIREDLPKIIATYNIRSILDIPCGDFHWMKEIDLGGLSYLGVDIVPELIAGNRNKYKYPNVCFECGDLIKDSLPPVDLVICRDWVSHFSFPLIRKALTNIARSRSKYLLTTTHINASVNEEIRTTGLFRPVNLQLPPFSFPDPLGLIQEQDDFGKSLGLWGVDTIPRSLL
jgi:SAM-dependent methyltransferase